MQNIEQYHRINPARNRDQDPLVGPKKLSRFQGFPDLFLQRGHRTILLKIFSIFNFVNFDSRSPWQNHPEAHATL